ncbi:MAG TPA: zinc ribbon domain-containing protein [Geminicoccaceae bacterium]|nr:zinc ribbon domain-containing protein [Geminicoccaceae bacterium]
MPLYDYCCAECGGFRMWRRMSEAGDPAACPSCDTPARRTMVAPNLALMPANNRIAHQRNEKSAHEPKVISGGQMQQGHGHAHGHNHAHGHGHRHSASGRPWMIGH